MTNTSNPSSPPQMPPAPRQPQVSPPAKNSKKVYLIVAGVLVATVIVLVISLTLVTVLGSKATEKILDEQKEAKTLRTRAVCTRLEIGVNAFESEYNYLPYSSKAYPKTDTQVMSNNGVISVLAGLKDDINFKQIRFVQIPEPKGDDSSTYRDGMHTEGKKASIYDPWGNYYYIVMDYDLDGIIQHPFKKDQQIKGKRVIIYSAGPDGKLGTDERNKDNISNF